jgi:hypothetical protein
MPPSALLCHSTAAAQGVERERKDWPWNDWTWEARDQYAERAAAAALLPGADLVAVPNSDADGDKPVTITDVPSTDGSFTEGERTVLLVRRAMVVLARAPVFNAHRAEALKMKEQGMRGWEVKAVELCSNSIRDSLRCVC